MDTVIPDLPIEITIYRLTVGDKWYTGSTERFFSDRIRQHYDDGLKYPERKLYKAVSEIGGWKNVRAEVLERFVFVSNPHRWIRENALINLSDPNCLNDIRAHTTAEEKRERLRKNNRADRERLKNDPERLAKRREADRIAKELIRNDPVLNEKRLRQMREARAKRRADPEIRAKEIARHKELRKQREALAKAQTTAID